LVPYLHGLDADQGRSDLDQQSIFAAEGIEILGNQTLSSIAAGQFLVAGGINGNGLGLSIDDISIDVDPFGLLRSNGSPFTFVAGGLGGEAEEPAAFGIELNSGSAVEEGEFGFDSDLLPQYSDIDSPEQSAESTFAETNFDSYQQPAWASEPVAESDPNFAEYATAGIDVIARNSDYELRSVEPLAADAWDDGGSTASVLGPDLVTDESEWVATLESDQSYEGADMPVGPVPLSERLQTNALKAFATVAGLWRRD
jgi:hypothetical protein